MGHKPGADAPSRGGAPLAFCLLQPVCGDDEPGLERLALKLNGYLAIGTGRSEPLVEWLREDDLDT